MSDRPADYEGMAITLFENEHFSWERSWEQADSLVHDSFREQVAIVAHLLGHSDPWIDAHLPPVGGR